MSTPGRDAAARLGELIGAGGSSRLALAYRLACEHDELPADRRWTLVVELLAQGLELASALNGEVAEGAAESDESAPCVTCGGQTELRVLGHAWHYSCWMTAGAPDVPEDATPTVTDSETPDQEATVTAAESATDATEQPAGADTSAETERGGRNAQSRSSARRGQRFELNPAEELHDWSREVRSKVADATDEQCSESLAAWHAAVVYRGDPVRFVSSPGYTGVAVYEWLSQRHGSMARPAPLQSEQVWALSNAHTTVRELSFINQEQTPEVGQSVTEVDVNAQYLAAARSAKLGDGEPKFLEKVEPRWREKLFKQPGYVQLGTAPDLSDLPVTARMPFAGLDADWWMPCPAARYLQHDHGVDLDVAQAFVWPTGSYGNRLSVWCGVFAEARATLTEQARAGSDAAALALTLLKDVYATYLGGMTRSQKHNDTGTLRPDWHDQYVTQAGVNALRALGKITDATPLGGVKDSFWFLSPSDTAPFQPAELTYSDQPGKWHVNRWGTVDENLVNAHRSGRPTTLRKAITQADKTRRGQ
ncbi:MAG: hypothetical protein ACRDMV_18280 [Streptosporangiales bacterium]